MQKKDYFPVLEAVIFSSKKPVRFSDLLSITGLESDNLQEILDLLIKKYRQEEFGILLKKYNDAYIFKTKKQYADYVEKLFDINKVTTLSTAAMETLAIIAYRQPVTRSEIEEIRGVKVERTLSTLGKYNLIMELGRKETIGNPILYGTTDEFLQHLDIEDLSQLPEIEKIEQLFIENIKDKKDDKFVDNKNKTEKSEDDINNRKMPNNRYSEVN
ncbi:MULTISPECIES: SMC-Scp complex subunit ScpB [unclassified Halanaerobium]|uniref:SMC-Scp complex subunit ScpB n=1 Tax=unclassified Halanaerobium TaxID=2641197 RepID=UPI000DF28C3F|nr:MULTISPECIES: SMC-Scp complex subunit ScpB [unclassified Halanaerobium]RCW50574.1 segregation and condensation protein B [Halanaerobium sp. MA284_MarDTE_T2]RCW82158.1 segregation and condensation protein B [Halanaerobium sp. DL-01]